MRDKLNKQPIGIFDSGVGGLTVFKEIRKLFPFEDIVYFGDKLAGANVEIVQDGNVFAAGTTAGMFALDDTAPDACYEKVTDDPTACNGMKFLVVSAGGEARVFEIKSIQWGPDLTWGTADDECDLKDLTTGKGDRDDINLNANMDVGFTTIRIDVVDGDADGNFDGIEFTTINNYGSGHTGGASLTALFNTELDGEVDMLHDGVAGADIGFFDGTNGNLLGDVYLNDGDTDDDIDLSDTVGLTWHPLSEDEDDIDMALDLANWGALFTRDTAEDESVSLEYPEEEVVGKAYVSEELATIPELIPGYAGGAAMGAYDDEIATVQDMNLISVGGSGINSVSADLLGLDYPTYGDEQAWIDATGVDALGKAMIQIIASPYAEGKYAMVVAGYEDADTARAAKVLREGTPTLTGDKVLLDTATETVTVI